MGRFLRDEGTDSGIWGADKRKFEGRREDERGAEEHLLSYLSI
jgi:hypothetical protein